MKRTIAILCAPLLFACAVVRAVELPGPVVTPQWLAEHRADVTVLDVRDDVGSFTAKPSFEVDPAGKQVLAEVGGHIPGALLLDFAKVRVEREVGGAKVKGMLPSRADFQALMQGIGLDSARPIVVVPLGELPEDLDSAARVYWSLKYYGEDRLAILDGGTVAWLQAGLPHASDAAPTARGDWVATAERKALLAESEDVAQAAAHHVQLVDARPLPFYLGLQKKPNIAQAGRLAGARNFPPDLRSGAAGAGQIYYTAPQYRAAFGEVGIDAAAPTITYCNTGHQAAGAWFIMSELLKNPGVRLYDGSLAEWTAEKRPLQSIQ
jgi:thiosulfate/3-mercaptopyruvate sulfurtransferase